jgi:hypothetical protein
MTVLAALPTAGASAASAPSVTTSVLYVGHGVGVIAAESPSGCNAVFLTTDFTRWRNISPPNKVVAGSCLYVWTSASFVSSEVGWILGRNEGSPATNLEHTTNGGRTWVEEPGDSTGSNAGEEVISFLSSSVGWRQQFSWSANSYRLQRTIDGGATWATRAYYPRTGCPVLTDVFSSASVGFAGSPLAGSTMGFGNVNLPYAWRTVNGGSTWSKMTLPHPSSMPRGATGLYGLPVFAGRDGSLPVDYPVSGHQDLFFYGTVDFGLHWSLIMGAASPLVVKGPVRVDGKALREGCYTDETVSKGSLASVSLASPSTWWALRPGPVGDSERFLIQKGSVSRLAVRFLPDTTGRAILQTDSSTRAVVTLWKGDGTFKVYVTVDGGAGWYPLTPPSVSAGEFSEGFIGGGIANQ